MTFRLIVSDAGDLTTIRVVGRLANDALDVLKEACEQARRPVALDLSDLRTASPAGVLLLRRLASEGIDLLGASPYMALLQATLHETAAPGRPRRQAPRPPGPSTRSPRHRRHGS